MQLRGGLLLLELRLSPSRFQPRARDGEAAELGLRHPSSAVTLRGLPLHPLHVAVLVGRLALAAKMEVAFSLAQ